jgi:hypothetical protein
MGVSAVSIPLIELSQIAHPSLVSNLEVFKNAYYLDWVKKLLFYAR